MSLSSTCRCECGYRCGGPGICQLPNHECISAGHFVSDCGHDFSQWKEFDLGGTMVCSRCGMTAIGHDSLCGP